ncbi:MAG: AAA family ATPase [Bacteriovorax sp.]|nr:AAA family ATPase [Bacteriovorax sp.]
MIYYKKNLGNGKHSVTCINTHNHTTESTDSSTVLFDGSGLDGAFGYKCFHSHCQHINVSTLVKFYTEKGIDLKIFGFFSDSNKKTTQDSAPEKMSFETYAEFDLNVNEKIEWVVDGLLARESTSLVIAQPKVGKSELSRDLSASVAKGESFLGFSTKRGPVLLIPLEENRKVMKEKFNNRGLTSSDNNLFIAKTGNRITIVEDLEEAIIKFNPALVIIDTLQRVVGCDDMNDYTKTYNKIMPFNKLARKYGCHILFIHHANKYGNSGQQSVLGSTGLPGSVDMLVYLQKNEDKKRIISTEPRYGEAIPPTVLEYDKSTGRFSLGKQAFQEKIDSVRNDIMDILAKEQTRIFSHKELKDLVGGNAKTFTKGVNQLCEESMIIRTGTGKKNNGFNYQQGQAAPF